MSDDCCSGKWYFPPIVPDPREPTQKRRPLSPDLRFYLPETHCLSFDPSKYGDDGEVFLLFTIGFAKGLFLVQEGWGHVMRTAVQVGQYSGFYCRPRAVVEMVDQFEWLVGRHNDGPQAARNAIAGVICWYMFSQNYRLSFEEFLGQYTVLDSICRLYEKTRNKKLPQSHSERPEILCSELGVKAPAWVVTRRDPLTRKKQSELSQIRNALVHEGMFGDKPALLGTPDQDLLEEIWGLHEFNRSLVLALIDFNPGGRGDPPWSDPIWGEYHGFDSGNSSPAMAAADWPSVALLTTEPPGSGPGAFRAVGV